MNFRSCPVFLALSIATAALAEERLASIQTLRFEPVDAKRDREVPLKVYLGKIDAPQSIILFSHGLGGSRDGNPYLGNHWAAGGFVVVFMQHAGSDAQVWKSVRPAERMRALKDAASAGSSRDRFADVPFVIDQLQKWNQEKDHPLFGKLDLEHIGMSGHSFGAVTTLAVAGRRFPFGLSFADNRIDAFLALSPSPGKGVAPPRAFGHLSKPILCMTGTKDDSPIDPSVDPQSRQEVFAALPTGDKYQLVFDGGHHFTFSDTGGRRNRGRDPKHHPAIQQISLRFWNAYLKNDAASKQWLKSNQPVADCELKTSDLWQWK